MWDHNATHLLYTWKLPASQDTAHVSIGYFARGVAVNAAQDGTVQLCVGSSTGDARKRLRPASASALCPLPLPLSSPAAAARELPRWHFPATASPPQVPCPDGPSAATAAAAAAAGAIYIFAVDAMGRVRPATSLQYNGSPIVALGSACQSRGGSGQEGGGDDETAMVSSGEDGSVVVWEAASSSSYKARGAIDGGSQPCTSIAVRKGLLICARLNGVVQMYDLASLTLRAELVAHSRLLTCMDIHPRKDIIVTASEDCTVHVWQLPLAPSDKVAVLMSVCWLHAPMWGVAFCGPERDDIAAVGYDTDEIQVWRAKPA